MCKYIEPIIIFWIPFFTMQKLSETIMFVLFCFPFFKFIYLLLFFLGIWVLCFISGIPGSFRSNFFPSENDSFTDGCNHRCMTHHTSMVYMGPPGTFNFQGYYVFPRDSSQIIYIMDMKSQFVCSSNLTNNSRWNYLFFASQVNFYIKFGSGKNIAPQSPHPIKS